MTKTTEWFEAMGDAVKERNRARAMLEQWQRKVTQAEARIQELAGQDDAPEQVEVPTEQVQEQ